jgi:hypothetical protein
MAFLFLVSWDRITGDVYSLLTTPFESSFPPFLKLSLNDDLLCHWMEQTCAGDDVEELRQKSVNRDLLPSRRRGSEVKADAT